MHNKIQHLIDTHDVGTLLEVSITTIAKEHKNVKLLYTDSEAVVFMDGDEKVYVPHAHLVEFSHE